MAERPGTKTRARLKRSPAARYHRPVSALDEDTSIMRTRILATPLELRHAEQEPQSRARGIGVGVLLGALVWVAAIAVAVLLYRWATTWV